MDVNEISNHVLDPARLAALRAVALLDTPTEKSFDRLSRLATKFLDAPVALVTLVDANRQFFKSCIGLPEPWATTRETPLSHSFCQHNRIAGQPLIIEDARNHPVFKSNLAIRDLNVIAYLGFPLVTPDGYVLGSFCVIDSKPRKWNDEDVGVIRDLSASVMTEIQLRTEIAGRQTAEGERDELAELNTRLRDEMAARGQAEEERRHLESELHQTHKLEAIGQLAGGMAHDFNNLLTPILGYSELLHSVQGLNDKLKNAANEIQHAGLRARDLVRQILAFSRKQTLQFKPLDLNTTVVDVEKMLRRTIAEDIEIKIVLAPEMKPILADISQIEQIIMNLVVNAADAMPDGGILSIETGISESSEGRVDVDSQPQSEVDAGPYAVLTIRDTGCGIDEVTREHIFEPFYSTKGERGTGLGLATVFGIVKQHGGVISLSSQIGKGTEFRIYLPITQDTHAPIVSQACETLAVDKKRTETILLVDDDQQVLDITKIILEMQGHAVLEAKGGVEALERLVSYEGSVNLLMTDVVMPYMNGRELYEKASKLRPGLKVLYMSGYAEDVISHRGVVDKDIQFITKPFNASELKQKIIEILDRWC